MKVTILGTGTSIGVPLPGCECEVCLSDDPKNKRLRTSALIETSQSTILIDVGPDFRFQSLRAGIKKIDAVLLTHTHADHVFGIDDLRAYNFITNKTIPLYTSSESIEILKSLFQYIFNPDPNYLGGGLPQLELNRISSAQSLFVDELEILPLDLKHGNTDVLGFRIGKFAYLTDCSFIPDESKKKLEGLEILVIDGLRDKPHPTHFTHRQAIAEIEALKPKKTYLTHISHDIEHEARNEELKSFTKLDVELAYDSLTFEL